MKPTKILSDANIYANGCNWNGWTMENENWFVICNQPHIFAQCDHFAENSFSTGCWHFVWLLFHFSVAPFRKLHVFGFLFRFSYARRCSNYGFETTIKRLSFCIRFGRFYYFLCAISSIWKLMRNCARASHFHGCHGCVSENLHNVCIASDFFSFVAIQVEGCSLCFLYEHLLDSRCAVYSLFSWCDWQKIFCCCFSG